MAGGVARHSGACVCAETPGLPNVWSRTPAVCEQASLPVPEGPSTMSLCDRKWALSCPLSSYLSDRQQWFAARLKAPFKRRGALLETGCLRGPEISQASIDQLDAQ